MLKFFIRLPVFSIFFKILFIICMHLEDILLRGMTTSFFRNTNGLTGKRNQIEGLEEILNII